MKNPNHLSSRIVFALGAVLTATLTGCIVPPGPPHPAVYVEGGVVQDDYVYYPGYEVYYGGNRHQYYYREGRTWVTRPTPPRVSAEVLLAAPSVHLDFHDAPAAHHAAVVRQYPRQWAPPGGDHGRKEGGKDHN
jgi:hypothetical protein